jgi:UDP-N-acetylglucosamine--N-acetylmuramyl-(pentapeptide) pyrophosphoryl-undecaprenol N-acetylglucosamine transferase
MPRALLRAREVVARLAPDVVLGVGGFVSGPVVLAAALSGVPCAVAEQNALPGLTNRLLSRVVRRIYTAFPEAGARFPRGKVELLGNPVREAIRLAAARAAAPGGGRRVLVMGGSQGARALNERLPTVFAALAARFPDLSVRHQAGRGNADDVEARYVAGRFCRRARRRVHRRRRRRRSSTPTSWSAAAARRPSPSSPASADRPSSFRSRSPPTTIRPSTPKSLVAVGAARMLREAELLPGAPRAPSSTELLTSPEDCWQRMGRRAPARAVAPKPPPPSPKTSRT